MDDQFFREKIMSVLEVYPVISPSMLHAAIGSVIPSGYWKPALQGLIEEGLVEEGVVIKDTPKGPRTHKTLKLIKRQAA